ncbi:MAG TPA: hypothetical protein VFB06_12400 [Streptosporangiaceae bacterium]|nr:hypothetical protein [Streptosporangiaceae bacterium]
MNTLAAQLRAADGEGDGAGAGDSGIRESDGAGLLAAWLDAEPPQPVAISPNAITQVRTTRLVVT